MRPTGLSARSAADAAPGRPGAPVKEDAGRTTRPVPGAAGAEACNCASTVRTFAPKSPGTIGYCSAVARTGCAWTDAAGSVGDRNASRSAYSSGRRSARVRFCSLSYLPGSIVPYRIRPLSAAVVSGVVAGRCPVRSPVACQTEAAPPKVTLRPVVGLVSALLRSVATIARPFQAQNCSTAAIVEWLLRAASVSCGSTRSLAQM